MPASYSNTFSQEEERKSLRMNENSKNILLFFYKVYTSIWSCRHVAKTLSKVMEEGTAKVNS